MSIGKKHRLVEGDGENSRPGKKVKTGDMHTSPSTDSEILTKKERRRKEKKERKARKEKHGQDREERKVAREQAQEQPSTEDQTDSNADHVPPSSIPYEYKQTSNLDAVADSEIRSFLSSHQITISAPADSLRPILQFAHLPPTALLSKSPFASFAAPTPIQSASWPFSLSGRDVIGIAETGSGKTLAFSLPCVELLSSLPRPPRDKASKTALPRAVVVSPTRELAMQTHAAISSLASLVGLSAVCLYGGASKDEQRALLRQRRGADIVVATPGRLKDFLGEGSVSLGHARFVVLDEADRMLDKGFEEDVKLILGSCPERESRQTLMFTATWPTSVRGLAEGFMREPVRVTIGGGRRVVAPTGGGGGNGEEDGRDAADGVVELQANSRISQGVEVVDPRGKEQRLLQLLREAQQGRAKNDRILVFCLYKKEAVRVEQFLEKRGVRVASIHGDLRQEHRTRSLEAFKAGTTAVLVATDVAARGLDIPEVKLVINLTFPLTIEDYVHRIGRTGRAGKAGRAITLFTEHDKAHSGSLINVLRAANQPVPEELLKFGTTVKKKSHDTYGAFFRDVDMSKKGKKITFD